MSRAKKRLTKELAKIQRSKLDFALVTPVEEKRNDNKITWNCILKGPKDSPYEKGRFTFEMEFPEGYPMKAPEITFKTKIYHPQIETKTGKLCPNILSADWAPTLNVLYVLEKVHNILAEPTVKDPVEEDIAEELANNPKRFVRTAKDW